MIRSDTMLLVAVALTPLIFLFLPMRRAVIYAYCGLWMFLPIAALRLPGIPPLQKEGAVGLAVIIPLLLFYSDKLFQQYKLRWFDIPIALFGFFVPFTSAMLNDMGVEGAAYETINMLFLWVVPYFIGRTILGDELGVHALAVGLFYSALIYVPFAWWEMLMSPQLHNQLYGYHQHEFQQTKRGWSYRPMVFMHHGLMTSMWLVAGSLCGCWLLYFKRLPWKFNIKPKYAVGFCVFTAAVSNSAGALLLMVFAACVLVATRRVNPKWIMVPLILVAPIYMGSRSMQVVTADDLTELVRPAAEDRAASLNFRLKAEDAYVAKAMRRPVLGWGGGGRHRAKDPITRKQLPADGLWIIVLGKTGLVGLGCMLLTLLAIPILITQKQTRRVWRHPRFAAASVLTVLLCIYMIDNLLNAMVNPIYMLAAGSLASFATQPLAARFGLKGTKRRATARRPAYEDQPVGSAA